MDDGTFSTFHVSDRPHETFARGSVTLNPIGGGGGGGGVTMLPLVHRGQRRIIGLVYGNSTTAITIFKLRAVGSSASSADEVAKALQDRATAVAEFAFVEDISSTSWQFTDEDLERPSVKIQKIDDGYQEVLDSYNGSLARGAARVKGVVVPVGAEFCVRPVWSYPIDETVPRLEKLLFGSDKLLEGEDAAEVASREGVVAVDVFTHGELK